VIFVCALDVAEEQMTKLHKSYWLLNNLGNVLSPAVTLLYWTTVYNPSEFHLAFYNPLLLFWNRYYIK
jgi:hypothetical protein